MSLLIFETSFVLPKQPGIPPLIRPPIVPDFINRNENGQSGLALDRNGPPQMHPLSKKNFKAQSPVKDGLSGSEGNTEGMNELFAKMVWKKLDLIKDPVRLSRLHIEIMNILQMAVAEESSAQPHQ
uniref:BESS domain-containing protein n=1 Tax=Syphacia muris TaxID=451379 RepID=A0A0N5AJC3_9BILA